MHQHVCSLQSGENGISHSFIFIMQQLLYFGQGSGGCEWYHFEKEASPGGKPCGHEENVQKVVTQAVA